MNCQISQILKIKASVRIKFRALTAFILCALALSILASCGGADAKKIPAAALESAGSVEKLIVIGFSQVGAESDWRLANTKSMRETFTESKGYRMILRDAQQKQENQIAAIQEFVAQKVDFIVFAPRCEEGWDDALKEAKAAGIPVIIVDRMIKTADESLFTCWVGSDFRGEGDTAVAWMESAFKDKDSLKIVHLQGSLGSSAQIGRTLGLQAGVDRNPGWELLYQASGDFTQVKGKEIMEYVLKQHNQIDVLYCENDNMAFGAIEAMDVAGKLYGVKGGVAVVSFDATRGGLEATILGKINFNVECNPLHGPRVEAIIKQLINGETPDKLAYVEEASFDALTITQADIDARLY